MTARARSAAGRWEASLAPLIVPASLLILGLLVGPMLALFRFSLNRYSPTELMVEALTLDNYITAFSDRYYQDIMVTTLTVAFITTMLTLLLGFPAAYKLARINSRHKSLLVLLVLFPLLIGNVVRSAGWLAILGNTGLVNTILLWTGLVSSPLRIIYTPTAVIVGLVAVMLPYMVLTLASVVESIPRDVEEAAANMGARPATAFFRIVMPLALPGISVGCTIVFILSMNAYATPVLLGGPRFRMMSPAIYDQFVTTTNWPFGAALAFILLGVTTTVALVGGRVIAARLRTS